jgi:hypothetical protein
VTGTPEAEDTLYDHPQLTITTAGVLTLALNLPYEEYPFTIFMDNLFTTLPLFSTLRGYGIGACGTARADRFLGHFAEETLESNNSKLLQWGEIRTVQECPDEYGEPVLFIVWQDQKVVKLMSTVHDGTGYQLRPRRRPKNTSTMTASTRAIFELPDMPPVHHEPGHIVVEAAQRFFAPKLALPVILPIDDYNYNMNGVDIADQLRAEMSTYRITRRSWFPYWFWLLDTTIVNAFLLWHWEMENRCVGRALEHERSQRVFREALVQSLIGPPPVGKGGSINNGAIPYIRITKGHQLRMPVESRFLARTHSIRRGSPYLECYYCRYKHSKGVIRRDEIRRNRTCCVDCGVPLCYRCFGVYHNKGNYGALASGFI